MKLTFLGHAAFILEGEGIKALIDPYLKGNPLAAVQPDSLQDITHIFVTHGHRDHLGDTESIAKRCNSLVVCNYELGYYLEKRGLKTHTMHIGGRISMGFGTVKMVPSLHGSGIVTEDGIVYGGNPCGFLIEVEGKKIYHAGDTGLTKEMELLEEESIDMALLPIGGNYTMDSMDASRAVGFIKPKKVIPIHFNTFGLIKADPEVFRKRVGEDKVLILNPGDSLEI